MKSLGNKVEVRKLAQGLGIPVVPGSLGAVTIPEAREIAKKIGFPIMPAGVREAVSNAYNDICREAGLEDVPVAVRSSAAGEDSRKKAFAGLQDTYLNIVGASQAVRAYQWDCASAYNLRSMPSSPRRAWVSKAASAWTGR